MAVRQHATEFLSKRQSGGGFETKSRFTHLKNEVIAEDSFLRALYLERKRSERSQRPFLLALMKNEAGFQQNSKLLDKIVSALMAAKRETDSIGWYEGSHVLGLLFTEFAENGNGTIDFLRAKVVRALAERLTEDELAQVEISFHVFPEDDNHPKIQSDLTLYPDITRKPGSKKASQRVKRMLDIIGSLFAIALLLPVFVVVAIAVKLTSSGPMLFRQERVGQYGRSFTFLKFRSMYTNCDSKIHEQYVAQFIGGNASKNVDDSGKAVFKITQDPRITPLGRFLRKTSLDELPQFFNVLRGDMSLVGPRPPVPYEFKKYNPWHRRRVVEAKPGITGQWQISGRSKTTFDEMVRLDIRYIDEASLWRDLKILIKTPLVIVSGDGGY